MTGQTAGREDLTRQLLPMVVGSRYAFVQHDAAPFPAEAGASAPPAVAARPPTVPPARRPAPENVG